MEAAGIVVAGLVLVAVIVDDSMGVIADAGVIPVLTTYIGNAWGQVQQIFLQLEQSIIQLYYNTPQLQQYFQQFAQACPG